MLEIVDGWKLTLGKDDAMVGSDGDKGVKEGGEVVAIVVGRAVG